MLITLEIVRSKIDNTSSVRVAEIIYPGALENAEKKAMLEALRITLEALDRLR